MPEKQQLQVIAVLSVESDKVSFTAISSADGREIATFMKRLPMIVGNSIEISSVTSNPCQSELIPDIDPLSSIQLFPGDVEQDSNRIWEAVIEVMNHTTERMSQDDVPVTLIKSIAIVNEMETLMVWDVTTGKPLHNAIHWTDIRMKPRNDKLDQYMCKRGSCGGGGTAAAVEWLLTWSPSVMCVQDNVRFGTLDAWLLWKLTEGQTYSTDLTNASYTGLLDLSTLKWDQDACRACGLSAHNWPSIRPFGASATIVMGGHLLGLSVHVTMARPSATLYGQGCGHQGQASVTLANWTVTAVGSYDDRGRGPPQPSRYSGGPLPVVAYCEPDPKDTTRPNVVYGLLTVSEATSIFCWLKNSVSLVSSLTEIMNAYSTARPAGNQAFIVPALNGLPFAPYGRLDARMVVCGISELMGREHLIVAAVDSVCYNATDMVRCIAGSSVTKRMDIVFVDGLYSNFSDVLQRLANISGVQVIRNQEDMAVRGAFRMSAAMINANYRDQQQATSYMPASSIKQRMKWTKMWNKALRRSYGWVKIFGQKLDDGFVVAKPSNHTSTLSKYLAQWYSSLTNNMQYTLLEFRNIFLFCNEHGYRNIIEYWDD